MAEEQDQSQKTEEPTEKKLREAREKGQVAKSQEGFSRNGSRIREAKLGG